MVSRLICIVGGGNYYDSSGSFQKVTLNYNYDTLGYTGLLYIGLHMHVYMHFSQKLLYMYIAVFGKTLNSLTLSSHSSPYDPDILVQATTLNVAINSHSTVLLTIMMSNNLTS